MLLQEAISTEFLVNATFEVALGFPSGYELLNNLLISNAEGLTDLLIRGGSLKTPVYTVACYATETQDSLLHKLYRSTVHFSYIDQRYPISVVWGPYSNRRSVKCYLADYAPPTSVNYSQATLLQVSLTLRKL